jgi:circadian clock protein KaiB
MPYVLKLFVNGGGISSRRALTHLQTLAAQLGEHTSIEVIDILDHPDLAMDHHIVATPTLVRTSPLPQYRIVSDLTDIKKILSWLSLDSGENAPTKQ